MSQARQRPSTQRSLAATKRPGPSGEFERIAWIQHLLELPVKDRRTLSNIQVGIGDDAAVLRVNRGNLVWTVDSSIEDVHFKQGWLDARDIGWRSFQAATSDLAAMAATPLAALSALELPKSLTDRTLMQIVQGQNEAAECLRCPIVGGNMASAQKIAITTSVLGQASKPPLRSNAKVGDELWLIGDVGLAAAGLACLMKNSPRRRGSAVDACIAAWRRPKALIEQGQTLRGRAHAAIDISDGLVGDAAHIAESSRVALHIDMDALSETLSPELCRVAERFNRSALSFALYGGEDYALFAAGPGTRRPPAARVIGRVLDGEGVWGFAQKRAPSRLMRGFDHFQGHWVVDADPACN
jgi:thiamine-monophosphate kinase